MPLDSPSYARPRSMILSDLNLDPPLIIIICPIMAEKGWPRQDSLEPPLAKNPGYAYG
jgi:hypothetical protein